MDRKKPVIVTYRVIHCSSQDKQYPVSELLFQSPDAKGWQTARFCAYPQTVVLQLVEPTVVRQIAVLSHQSKISTKIQIQTKLQEKQQWKRLGYMSLQSNSNTNYQTRQLRKVNINNVTSQFLRFTMYPNYVNNHNPFNQVGIISLCIYGDKVISDRQENYGGQRATSSQLDKNTLNKIRSLQIEKKQAIQNEDFDRAKYLKQQIQRIKSIGHSLMQLQQRKKIAVANQNFEDAKILNQQIKKLRDSNGGGPNFTTRPSGSSSQYYRPIKQQQTYPKQVQQSISPNTPINQQKYSPKPPKKLEEKKVRENKPTSYDDQRPIHVKNSDPYNNFEEDEIQQKGGQSQQLQQLNAQLRKHCYEYFGILDQEIFRHIFSKNHIYRQKGLQLARNQMAKSSVNKDQLAKALLFIVKSLIDDKVNSVLLSCIQLFDMILKRLKPSGNCMQHIDYILEKLADYLGNNNEKTRITTQQIYSGLPNYPLTNRDNCYRALSTIGKRDKPPKILTGRLKMLSILVQSYQLGKNYENVIQYAVKYADDKNNEVRNCAINLIASISKEIGYGNMQGYLKNIRPQIMKAIEQKLDGPQMGDERPIRKAQSRNLDRSQQKKSMKNQKHYQTDNQFMEKNQPKQLPNSEYVCDFCDLFDKKLQNENYRDLHLFNACPMLTVCPQCKQALQVSSFTQHLMGECPNSKYYKKCPRCKQAVHQRNYKSHVESKQCLPAKPLAQSNRCPLCHLDIEPGAEGWKTHMLQQGCDNNPRK